MPFFTYINFSERLFDRLLKKDIQKTVIIFPNKKTRDLCLSEFRKSQPFNETLFETIEEFKNNLYLTDKPILNGEKRLITLFSSLPKDLKQELKMSNYFQFSDFGANFFGFFEEMNEELIQVDKIREVLEFENFFPQQLDFFKLLLKVREYYQKYLQKISMTDTIFEKYNARPDLNIYQEYDNFVIMNQFYYTNLEKDIIALLEANHKKIEIIYQLPQKFADKLFEKGCLNSLFLKDVLTETGSDYRLKSLEIFKSKNSFLSFNLFHDKISKEENYYQVLDLDYNNNSYLRLLSVEKFNLNVTKRLTETSLFIFLDIFIEILESTVSFQDRLLIPLDKLFLIVNNTVWFDFTKKRADCLCTQEFLTGIVHRLIEKDYKYVDVEMKFLKLLLFNDEPVMELKQFVEAFFKFLSDCSSIENANDFTELFKKIIDLDEIITEPDSLKISIKKNFFVQLANFNAVEEQGIVKDWYNFFNLSANSNSLEYNRLLLLKNFLRLFRKISKNIFIDVTLENNGISKNRIDIFSLLDSRNLCPDTLYVLNANDGILPSSRNIPFLLNEKQRKQLGLKTYEDIIIREKYYFIRTILNSRKVVITTLENTDENISPSSFVEELFINFPESPITEHPSGNTPYQNFYANFLTFASDHEPCKLESDFFKIPFDSENDFKEENLINLSFYNYINLKKNPFYGYLKMKNISQNPEFDKLLTISPKFIGNLTGEIFDNAWDRLINLYQSNINYNFSYYKENMAKTAIENTIASFRLNFYKLPRNFHYTFFSTIIQPKIIEAICFFYQTFLDKELGLSEKKLKVKPEEDLWSISAKIGEVNGVGIKIKGRPDLLIREKDSGILHIFDYKTGSRQNQKSKFIDQLFFYEYLYSLKHNLSLDKIKSMLFWVLEKKWDSAVKKKLTKAEAIENLVKDIKSTMKTIIEEDYSVSPKKSDNKYLSGITRYDLVNKNRGVYYAE